MADFVLDASLSLAWCFEDEATEFTESVLTRVRGGEEAIAPALWLLEVANGIRNGERRKRITPEEATGLLGFLDDLPIETLDLSRWTVLHEVAPLASEHNLSAYDAAYFYLAERRGLPIATLDGPLRRAAEQAGLAVIALD